MTVYIIVIVFMVLIGILIHQGNSLGIGLTGRKIYIIAVSGFLALLSGLRDLSVGNDTQAYVRYFDYVGNTDIKTLLTNTPFNLEKGYALYSWLWFQLIPNEHFFFLVISALCFVLIGYWMYKNSRYPIASYLVFLCLFFTFFLTGIRQGIAISISLLAFEQIKQRNLMKFSLLVIVAALFHRTAVVFFVAYPFLLSKLSIAKVSVIGITIPLLYQFRNDIFLWVTPIVGKEQYKI